MAARENPCCPGCSNRWMMSQDVVNEAYFLASSIFMGIVITFTYDFLLIGRRIISHSLVGISVEDFIFWAACAIGVFYMLYEENNGILRWFAVLGAALGMLLYKRIIGGRFVGLAARVIQKGIQAAAKALGFILRPFRWMNRKLDRHRQFCAGKKRRLHKCMKKKLTSLRKVLKISISKH